MVAGDRLIYGRGSYTLKIPHLSRHRKRLPGAKNPSKGNKRPQLFIRKFYARPKVKESRSTK